MLVLPLVLVLVLQLLVLAIDRPTV